MSYPPQFESFWQAYPKREGSNPKHEAHKSWLKSIKLETPENLILAAGNYAKAESAQTKTRFIPMTSTWLNQRRWEQYLEAPDPIAEQIKGRPRESWIWAIKMWTTKHYWPPTFGPDPQCAGCEVPKSILQEYGL